MPCLFVDLPQNSILFGTKKKAELTLVVEGPKICVLPAFFKSKGEMGEGQVIDK